jgi:hypothetical protein
MRPSSRDDLRQFPGSVRSVQLTGGAGVSLIIDGERMESRSIFISSCSRRQLARRRPHRSPVGAQLTVAVLLAVVAVALVAIARGWL